MPTNNMSNRYNKLVSKLTALPFVILVYELGSATMWQLNHPDSVPTKNTSFVVVLDELHQDSPVNYPNTYYCNNFEELNQVLDFVVDNSMLYYEEVINNSYITLLSEDIKIAIIK